MSANIATYVLKGKIVGSRELFELGNLCFRVSAPKYCRYSKDCKELSDHYKISPNNNNNNNPDSILPSHFLAIGMHLLCLQCV
jgi:hypothetical protein